MYFVGINCVHEVRIISTRTSLVRGEVTPLSPLGLYMFNLILHNVRVFWVDRGQGNLFIFFQPQLPLQDRLCPSIVHLSR